MTDCKMAEFRATATGNPLRDADCLPITSLLLSSSPRKGVTHAALETNHRLPGPRRTPPAPRTRRPSGRDHPGGVVLQGSDCLDGYCNTIYLATNDGTLLPIAFRGGNHTFVLQTGVRVTARGVLGGREFAGIPTLYDATVSKPSRGPVSFHLHAFLGDPAFGAKPGVYGVWAITGGGHPQGAFVGSDQIAITDLHVPAHLHAAVSHAIAIGKPVWLTIKNSIPAQSFTPFTLVSIR